MAIPIVAGAVSYYAGPVAGETVAYAGTRVQKRAAEAGYRGSNKELTSHERSQKARAVANRTFKYSQVGIGAGTAASAATSVAGGSSWSQTLGKMALGQAGGKLMGIGSGGTPKMGVDSGPGVYESVESSYGPGRSFDPRPAGLESAVTENDLFSRGTTGLGGQGPTLGSGAGNRHSWTDQVLGGLGTMLGGIVNTPGEKGSGKPGYDVTNPFSYNQPNGNVDGGEAGLLSNPLVLGLLAVGAVMLLK